MLPATSASCSWAEKARPALARSAARSLAPGSACAELASANASRHPQSVRAATRRMRQHTNADRRRAPRLSAANYDLAPSSERGGENIQFPRTRCTVVAVNLHEIVTCLQIQ